MTQDDHAFAVLPNKTLKDGKAKKNLSDHDMTDSASEKWSEGAKLNHKLMAGSPKHKEHKQKLYHKYESKLKSAAEEVNTSIGGANSSGFET